MTVIILLIMAFLVIVVVAGPAIERGIDRLWPPDGDGPAPTVRDGATSAGAARARPAGFSG